MWTHHFKKYDQRLGEFNIRRFAWHRVVGDESGPCFQILRHCSDGVPSRCFIYGGPFGHRGQYGIFNDSFFLSLVILHTCVLRVRLSFPFSFNDTTLLWPSSLPYKVNRVTATTKKHIRKRKRYIHTKERKLNGREGKTEHVTTESSSEKLICM